MGPLWDSLFVGVRIRHGEDTFLLSQERYAKAVVSKFGLNDTNECSTPMDLKEDWTPRDNDIPLSNSEKQIY